jgi:kinesin family protein 18/19
MVSNSPEDHQAPLTTEPTANEHSSLATKSNIMVAVRLRPLWKSEKDNNELPIVKIMDEKLVILRDPQDFDDDQTKNELRKNRSREKRYAFDFAFDDQTETTRVFRETACGLCSAVMDGFNSTVFAYGATGAGKTHTMLGNAEKPGIMFQTMRELFKIKT